jgi:hypothetical protein
VEVRLHSFLSSVLDVAEPSASRSSCSTRYQWTGTAEWCHRRSGRSVGKTKSLTLPQTEGRFTECVLYGSRAAKSALILLRKSVPTTVSNVQNGRNVLIRWRHTTTPLRRWARNKEHYYYTFWQNDHTVARLSCVPRKRFDFFRRFSSTVNTFHQRWFGYSRHADGSPAQRVLQSNLPTCWWPLITQLSRYHLLSFSWKFN